MTRKVRGDIDSSGLESLEAGLVFLTRDALGAWSVEGRWHAPPDFGGRVVGFGFERSRGKQNTSNRNEMASSLEVSFISPSSLVEDQF